jgi:tetratricopeptide (TPR) repeat protein
MKYFVAAFLLLVPLAFAAAQASQVLADADAMHDQGSYPEAVKLLLGAVASASGVEKAELYWRAARETLEIGDLADKAGKPQDAVLAVFVEGQGYADKAIAADPKNDLGYYWKSANIGRWGQVKGVLNALMKAQPMKDLLVKELSLNPDRTDPYYVLGELYRELPGWPVSFGNLDAAVSFGRRAVDARQAQVQSGAEREMVYNFFNELAKTLYKRNWSVTARGTEQKNKAAKLASATTLLDKSALYEATITLKDMSDRDEARALVQSVITELDKAASLTAAERKDLQKAKDVLKGW